MNVDEVWCKTQRNEWLTNLKNNGKIPRGPNAAGGYANGGGQINQLFRGTAIGNQWVRCGCIFNKKVRSRWQFITIRNDPINDRTVLTGDLSSLKSKLKRSTKAWTRYLLPPHSNFVDLDDVPEAKSSRSTQRTLKPRWAASNAAPKYIYFNFITNSTHMHLYDYTSSSCTASDNK